MQLLTVRVQLNPFINYNKGIMFYEIQIGYKTQNNANKPVGKFV